MPARASLLVIGGTGFFGKSLLDAYRCGLLAPWGIDRFAVAARAATSLARTHAELVGDGVELVDVDIRTTDHLPRADFVIHAANTTDARRYAEAPAAERANIVQAAENFAAVARRDLSSSRIVYTSSGAVYGQQPSDLACLPEEFGPGDAAGLVAYKRDYAQAKLLAEARVADLGREGLLISIARCFAFVGRFLPRDAHFAIGNFLEDGRVCRPIAVRATHPVIRSYMHADDLAIWLMTLAAGAAPDCPVVNVGSGEAVSMIDLARRVAARFGVGVDAPAQAGAPVDRYVPCVERAARRYGLQCRYDLDAAIEQVAGCLPAAPAPARL